MENPQSDEEGFAGYSAAELMAALAATYRVLRLAERERDENARLLREQQAVQVRRGARSDFFECAPFPCFVLDREGVIADVNRAGTSLLVRPSSKLVGESLVRAAAIDDHASFRHHLATCFASPEPCLSDFACGAGSNPVRHVLSVRRTPPRGETASSCYSVLADSRLVARSPDPRRAPTGPRIAESVRLWGRPIGLTDSEMDVASLLLVALSNKEIAAKRQVSVSTVRAQVSSIFKKASVGSRTELVLRVFATLLPGSPQS